MAAFGQLKAVKALKELSKNPLDLTKESVLTPKRVDAMVAEALGLKLFYATERVDEKILSALDQLAEETQALKKMESMQAGEVVNFIEGVESENRPALHTAMRDFFENRNTAPAAEKATKLAYDELQKIKAFLEEIERKDDFTDLIQIGIGGSELGPKAIFVALEAFKKPGRRVHFLSNVDPDEGAAIFREVNWQKTLVVVVSKSGSTLETMTNERYVRERFKKEGIDAKKRVLAVTGKGSPMDNPAEYRGCFYIWDYIGGRYSVTSMVGAVALA